MSSAARIAASWTRRSTTGTVTSAARTTCTGPKRPEPSKLASTSLRWTVAARATRAARQRGRNADGRTVSEPHERGLSMSHACWLLPRAVHHRGLAEIVIGFGEPAPVIGGDGDPGDAHPVRVGGACNRFVTAPAAPAVVTSAAWSNGVHPTVTTRGGREPRRSESTPGEPRLPNLGSRRSTVHAIWPIRWRSGRWKRIADAGARR